MNYQEARAFIDRVSTRGSELGLTSMTNLMEKLGNPQDDLKMIHVAGTNGKGSVLAYLGAVLGQAGYSVGRYISPTLFSYRERIQISGEPISREDFARFTGQVKGAMDEMAEQGLGLPTVFEVETAVSFLYFKEKACDIVLLEVGMGGRLDATNIIKKPLLTILASISMDHMAFLGNTLGEIAWNKAGIFKPGVPAVSAHQKPEAEQVIQKEADRLGCGCRFVLPDQIYQAEYGLYEQCFSYKEFARVKIRLAGIHQIENAALALEAVLALRGQGLVIPDQAVYKGLETARWKGRFSVIHENPLVIIDGAHNPDAALRLRDAIEKYFKNRKKYYIFGVFSDKEYDKIIKITAPLAEYIFTVETPDNPRALPAKELAEAVRKVNPAVKAADSIPDAVAVALAAAGQEDVILAFGSLSFLKDVEQAVQILLPKADMTEDLWKNC